MNALREAGLEAVELPGGVMEPPAATALPPDYVQESRWRAQRLLSGFCQLVAK